jgi:hypothetical protein
MSPAARPYSPPTPPSKASAPEDAVAIVQQQRELVAERWRRRCPSRRRRRRRARRCRAAAPPRSIVCVRRRCRRRCRAARSRLWPMARRSSRRSRRRCRSRRARSGSTRRDRSARETAVEPEPSARFSATRDVGAHLVHGREVEEAVVVQVGRLGAVDAGRDRRARAIRDGVDQREDSAPRVWRP